MIKEYFQAKRKVSFWKKINPLWWFGNEDDGWYGDDRWRAGREKTLLLAEEPVLVGAWEVRWIVSPVAELDIELDLLERTEHDM